MDEANHAYKLQITAGAKEVAVFASASESFSKRNINCTINESLSRYREVVDCALDNNIKVRGYVSCICGCPYEGPVPPQQVAKVKYLFTREKYYGCQANTRVIIMFL